MVSLSHSSPLQDKAKPSQMKDPEENWVDLDIYDNTCFCETKDTNFRYLLSILNIQYGAVWKSGVQYFLL